jgi:hypothetical protein
MPLNGGRKTRETERKEERRGANRVGDGRRAVSEFEFGLHFDSD